MIAVVFYADFTIYSYGIYVPVYVCMPAAHEKVPQLTNFRQIWPGHLFYNNRIQQKLPAYFYLIARRINHLFANMYLLIIGIMGRILLQ